MGPKATAQTSIGTVYLYSLRASDISEFRKLRADDPAERVREFLPCIASLSERSSFKEEREPLPTELAAQLTEADLDALGTAYASPTVLGAAREYHQCSLSERVGTTWKSACKPAQHLKYSVIRTVFNQITLWVRARLELGDSYSGAFAILCNPPFSNGAAHVLKAYDAIWDGEIVAILNADSVRNPFSRERQRLVDLIEQFGSYEIIEGAFAVPDADRKTDVDVALVYLKKTANVTSDIVGDLIGDLREDAERGAGLAGDYAPEQAVALPNSFIENSVITLNAAVSAMRDSVRSEARARHYAAMLGDTMAVHCGAQGSSRADFTTDWVKSELGQRYDELKDRAWANLLRSSDVTSRLSSAAQKRLESEFDQIKKLEYTVMN